jgi:CBS domain containing-hemolysin-like protein
LRLPYNLPREGFALVADPNLFVPLLAVTVVLLALFAGSEAAFVSLPPTAWRQSGPEARPGWRLVAWLHHHRAWSLTALLIGNVACLWAVVYLGSALLAKLLPPAGSIAVGFLAAALVVLPLAVLLPHCAAARRPDRSSPGTAPFVAAIVLLLSPVAAVVLGLSRLALAALGVKGADLRPPLTEEELKDLLAEGEEHGVLPEPQARMLYGVLDFADQTAAQVMTPRPDMVSIQGDRPLSEALALALSSRHRRLPVYGENDDDILGVLYLKDILPYVRSGDLAEPVRVATRSALHVPETLPANDLLRRMQQLGQTIAIVRDEFGGTAGLVTTEDLLEQIVGEIRDEDDLGEEPEIVEIGEDEYSCDGQVSLHPLANLLHLPLPDEQYDTLAGFVLDLAGRLLRQGEWVTWQNLTFIAERVRGNRLERIRVSRPAPAAEAGEGED